MRHFLCLTALSLAALCVLAACAQSSMQTPQESVAGPVPPTFTPVFPPDYQTPTPIPPEHQRFFVAMGDGGNGLPAIHPRDVLSNTDTYAPSITKDDVWQYVKSHEMLGERITIDYAGLEPSVLGIELVQLADVYHRYMPEALLQPWDSPYRPETQVYLVELQGTFRFSGGPAPGNRGTYHTGVWVFDARTGYDILEGGVGRVDVP